MDVFLAIVSSGLMSCRALFFTGRYREITAVKRAQTRCTGAASTSRRCPWGSDKFWAYSSLLQKAYFLYNPFRASCWIKFSVILFFFFIEPSNAYEYKFLQVTFTRVVYLWPSVCTFNFSIYCWSIFQNGCKTLFPFQQHMTLLSNYLIFVCLINIK